MNNILISIKPKYTQFIKNEKKFVELRRSAKLGISDVIVYESSPTKMIVGYFNCKYVECLPIDTLWERTKNISCITKEDFYKYFFGKENGYGIFFDKFHECESISLKNFFKNPPQNYYCLTDEVYNKIMSSMHNKT